MTRLLVSVAIVGVVAACASACAQANSDTVDASLAIGDASTDPSDASAIDAGAFADAAQRDGSPGLDARRADASAPAPDATPTPDATPPDATPCTPIWQSLLTNGDLESGNTAWTKAGNGGDIIRQSASLPFNPHAGAWAALLAGFNNADQTLSQTVTVPASANALRLRGYKCYVTTETSAITAYDVIDVELRNAAGSSVLETLNTTSNTDIASVCSWTAFQFDAASSHAGQTIQLTLQSVSDASSITSFAVDSMVLEAFACP